MLVIVDYKVGNLGSLLNMIKRAGGSAMISERAEDLVKADRIVLPGIGRFDFAMERLQVSGLIPVLKDLVFEKRVPTLGICVGAQMMMERSEENSEEGDCAGLGWFPGTVKKFNFSTDISLRVPHMGWDPLQMKSRRGLLRTLDPEENRFYFAHSYYMDCRERAQVSATVDYGHSIDVVLEHQNLSAVQFHPEKSHRFGMEIFKNFIAGTTQ